MKKPLTPPWWHHLLHRSNQPFQHPDTHRIPTTAPTPTNPTSPKVGDFINHFGLTFYWSSLHRSCQDLQPLRKEGDHLSDQALLSMRLGPSGDPIEQLLTSSDPSIVALYQQLTTVPSWVDWKRVKRGQEVFVRYAGGTGLSLLHCSLVGGFGAPKINKVLGATGYLSRSCSASFTRLFETLQMIVDCTENEGLVPKTGIGWRACVRVRILHAKVRRRLCSMDKWREEEWGVPINQEDMVATLLSFQTIVLECLDYMGFTLMKEEKNDYTHLWRLIGYYSGVEEKNNPCVSCELSRATLESITRHIVSPDTTSAHMSNHLLRAVANRPPLRLSYEAGAQVRIFIIIIKSLSLSYLFFSMTSCRSTTKHCCPHTVGTVLTSY
jgi:hypothetical protein